MSKAQALAFEEYGLATEPVLIILHGFFLHHHVIGGVSPGI